ncbi:MAG: sodium:proton antiporter [Clostridium sp.]|nr:sodium:proton antiporter [Clostridium sp.]MCM1171326.1 sodium:proton antiporter [Clostridium sp.]MCM1208527.1 sodium:proton antiporter [Ruminococcus sp.]
MDFLRNLPFFSIILSMVSAVIISIMSDRVARVFSLCVIGAVSVMSAITFFYVAGLDQSYTYYMGHFPAPWGNEIRVGILEALTATIFSIVMFASVLGGMKRVFIDVAPKKRNLYYIMVDLLLAALLAMIYTNDLFTGYVFIEIMTISACALIMSRDNGHCLVSAMKYMIMSLIGSGLILLGLSMLYDLTGHLLMSNIKEAIAASVAVGDYELPLTITVGLLCVGIAIKSALFPFHSWLPDAYGYSTATSSALLSSLISKGYIFLLIKIMYRVIGMDVIVSSKIGNVFFVFGVIGMIAGSVRAIAQTDVRQMIAYSSVAQIGYIYMGMGLGTELGMMAAVFHIFAHSSAKSMMFIAADGLSYVSNDSREFRDLGGSAIKNPIAGATFTVGACSMIGIPMLAGFISKVCFADAAINASTVKLVIVMLALAFSTLLNAVYFMRAIISIYRPVKDEDKAVIYKADPLFIAACIIFVALNVFLGTHAQPIIDFIFEGIGMFD